MQPCADPPDHLTVGPALRTRIPGTSTREGGWSLIFGRLVRGWMAEHAARDRPGLIVVNPARVGPDGGGLARAETVLDAAAWKDVPHRRAHRLAARSRRPGPGPAARSPRPGPGPAAEVPSRP